MEEFRVTHLSDLHLGRDANVSGFHHHAPTRYHIAKIFGQYWKRKNLVSLTGTYDSLATGALLEELGNDELLPSDSKTDAILISGDICSVGYLQELQFARNFLLHGVNLKRVQFPVEKMVIMPGNHDRYRGWPTPFLSGSANFEHVDAFDEKWSPGNEAVSPSASLVRERRIPAKKNKGGLSILCADFALSFAESSRISPFLLHFNGGSVKDEVLSSLARLTAAARDDGYAVVWAIHYPPKFPGHWRQQLRGYKRLLVEAKGLGVRHIFAGHTHEQLQYEVGGVHVHCAGTPTSHGSKEYKFLRHKIYVNPRNSEVLAVRSEHWVRKYEKRTRFGLSAYGKFLLSDSEL